MADGDITFTNLSFDYVSVVTDVQLNFVLDRNGTQVVPGPPGQTIKFAWKVGQTALTLAELQQYEAPAGDGDAIIFAPPLPPGQVP